MDAFLDALNLVEHAKLLADLGYDDPREFAEYEAPDLEKLEKRCAHGGMKPAHVDKLVRAVKKRSAVAVVATTAAVTPSLAPALALSSPSTLPLPLAQGGGCR